MATKYIESVGSSAGDAATELSRLKGEAAGNVMPVVFDAVDGFLKYYDRVAAAVKQVLTTNMTPVTATGNLTLTAALHAGRTVVLNALAGGTFTLPAATGTGNKYRIVVGTTLTSGSLVAAVPNATDYFRGFALFANDTDGSASNFETANSGTVATESDTITLNRTTTGIGTIGDVLEFEDIATAVWSVHVKAQASGTEATPFSAAV